MKIPIKKAPHHTPEPDSAAEKGAHQQPESIASDMPPKQHKRLPDEQPDFVYDPLKDKRHNLRSIAPDRPGKKKFRHWKKILLGLLIAGGIALAFFLVFTYHNVLKIAPNFFKLEQKLKGEDEGRVNILLLGVGDPGHDAEGLSDTNILVSLDTRNKTVAFTSIPRDTRVKIPTYGNAKINNANAYGGVPLAEQTVSAFLDQPIQYYVKANFTGLKQAVDAVGGIEIKNTSYLSDSEYPCDNNQWKSCGFTLKEGTYQANGTLALKYARCRKGTCGDDFGRAARQQEVIQGIRSKALSLGTILNPAKITSLIQTAGDNVKTDLSIGEMQRLNELTKDIPNDKFINVVFSYKTDGFLKQATDGSSDIVPVDSTLKTIQAFEKNIFTLGPIWQETPNVLIQNGTTTVGLGGLLEKKLNADSSPITVTAVANALKTDHTTTQVIDYTNGAKPNTKNKLQDLLKVQATSPETAVKNPAQDFTIIIGTDFANYLTVPSTVTR